MRSPAARAAAVPLAPSMRVFVPLAGAFLALTTVHPMTSDAQTRAPSLQLSQLIADRMVMQRDARVPVWGTAAPGARVTVTFDGHEHATTAAATGRWSVTLPAMPAGGPHAMTVAATSAAGVNERVAVRDILVGDVWLCSGQSNMEWVVRDARNGAAEIAAANDPATRHFKVPTSFAWAPSDSLAGGTWEQADAAHVGGFTAVGYFFARDIRKATHVPIGLLHTSWGGSRIEPWTSREALGLDDAAVARLQADERTYEAHALDALRARLGGTLPTVDAGLVDGRALWAAPELDDASWATIQAPGAWEGQGYPGMDGTAWYRTAFELTADEARAGVQLGLAQIDDADVSYVNGREIGRTNGYTVARVYRVPAEALHAGRNVIAVHVTDAGGGGGIAGTAAQLFVEAGGVRRSLAGAWKFRVGAVTADAVDGQHINKIPTLLYNKMIHPVLPFPVKGVLWYQGESNADRYEDAVAYRPLFAGMIRDWRRRWGLGDVPFLWVQLANYMAADTVPADRSNWAALRESQTAALELPHTGQAVIIDLGEGDNIHPRNKQDVGARLALVARRVAYGEPVEASGPVLRASRFEAGRVVLSFDHAERLAARPNGQGATADTLGGFAVAGEDRHFVWADARIEGGRVVVSSPRVPHPVAVRYAWGNNPVQANLYNAAGLPAPPFRTDRW